MRKSIINKTKDFWRYNVISKYKRYRRKRRNITVCKDIIKLYQSSEDKEILELVENIKRNRVLKGFNGNFALKYNDFTCDVNQDDSGDWYVIHGRKKLFFPKSFGRDKVLEVYKALLRDQDEESPHRYVKKYSELEGYVVLDIGGAEGIFSLDVVESAKKIYIFECNEKWISVLKKTFKPYGDKVKIINKYISDVNSNTEVTIDAFMEQYALENEAIFLKMDIEGMEEKAINGLEKLKQGSNELRASICAYHRHDAEDMIRRKFPKEDFSVQAVSGYMVFLAEPKLKAPYFRRGVMRVSRNKN